MRGARSGCGAQVVVEGRMPTMPPAALQEGPGCLLARGLLGGLAALSDTAALAAGNPMGVAAQAAAQAAAAARRPTAPPPHLLAEREGAADRATRTGIAVRSADQTGLHFGAFQVASGSAPPRCISRWRSMLCQSAAMHDNRSHIRRHDPLLAPGQGVCQVSRADQQFLPVPQRICRHCAEGRCWAQLTPEALSCCGGAPWRVQPCGCVPQGSPVGCLMVRLSVLQISV